MTGYHGLIERNGEGPLYVVWYLSSTGVGDINLSLGHHLDTLCLVESQSHRLIPVMVGLRWKQLRNQEGRGRPLWSPNRSPGICQDLIRLDQRTATGTQRSLMILE